jgi:hypothetical protein
MTRPIVCALCPYTSDRTDHVVRHMRLCHSDAKQYDGHNEVTGYTLSPVGNDFPHIVMATHPTRQAIGYCTQCLVGFHAPHSVKNPVNLAKHFKAHTCVEKQVRTRKVTVATEDASGNVVTKKVMQTGGVTVTEEMLLAYKKRDDMKHIEIEHTDAHNNPADVLGTIEKALKQASKMCSPAVRALLTAPAAPAAAVAAPAGDGPINWEAACKELATHRRVKTMMANMMRDEQERVAKSVIEAQRDADADIEELDWYEFMAGVVYRASRVELARKEKEQLLEKIDLLEGKHKREMFELSERLAYIAKLSEERDEENRKLRAALQQCQSKIELIVDDKKF